MQHNDLTFFTNEPERNLYDRFSKILKSHTQFWSLDPNLASIYEALQLELDDLIYSIYGLDKLEIDFIKNFNSIL